MKTLRGNPASPGLAIGSAHVITPPPTVDPDERRTQGEQEETLRLDTAIEVAIDSFTAAAAKSTGSLREILTAQEEMMRDPTLRKGAADLVLEGSTAEAAVVRVTSEYAEQLQALSDPYLAARAEDIREAGRRIVATLRGATQGLHLDAAAVLVAEDIAPGDLLQLDSGLIDGIVSEAGSPTGHLAIVAQGLGIPAVVGVPHVVRETGDGDTVVLDGDVGTVAIDPDEATRTAASAMIEASRIAKKGRERWKEQKGATADGVRVAVFANIGSIAEARRAVEAGAEGVGLFRSEFIAERGLPSEDEQLAIYSHAARILSAPLVVRTFDIGGDKPVPGLTIPPEGNPFLGLRGIRLALDRPEEVFLPQIRALLRAAVGHDIRVMLPMVSLPEEVVEARSLIERAIATLDERGDPFRAVPIGIMIETPAAALTLDSFVGLVDFFSIGTNDLTQYTYAADRTHPTVGRIARPLGLAMLRLMKNICEVGLPVAVCGRLASEPEAIPILVGLGVRELSVAPAQVPATKEMLSEHTLAAMRQLAQDALEGR